MTCRSLELWGVFEHSWKGPHCGPGAGRPAPARTWIGSHSLSLPEHFAGLLLSTRRNGKFCHRSLDTLALSMQTLPIHRGTISHIMACSSLGLFRLPPWGGAPLRGRLLAVPPPPLPTVGSSPWHAALLSPPPAPGSSAGALEYWVLPRPVCFAAERSPDFPWSSCVQGSVLPLGLFLPSPSQYSGPSASCLLYLGDAVVGQSPAEPTVHLAHVVGQVGAILDSKGVSVLLLPPPPTLLVGLLRQLPLGPGEMKGRWLEQMQSWAPWRTEGIAECALEASGPLPAAGR